MRPRGTPRPDADRGARFERVRERDDRLPRSRPHPAWQDRLAVETMRAVRKVGSEPGLVLDEMPVPTPGDDEVLVRIEAASICGTDLHIRRWDEWSAERVKPPLTLEIG